MATAQLNHIASFSQMKRIGNIINGKPAPDLNEILISDPNKFKGREGYRSNFIEGWEIKLPLAIGVKMDDMLKLKQVDSFELKYMHFSVIMSKSRKLPMLTATNIFGAQSKSLGRADKWYLDGRIEENQQFGNELYKDNRLDRGHMVRREDPVWGNDADTANIDTFHYTNCCPQVDVFNQQVWLGLENYILENARVHKMSLSVFTGPFFANDDKIHEETGARIPNSYWKIVAFLSEDGTPSATAYKISQEKELSQLEFVYGKYKTYQISIREVMSNTSIDFGQLLQFDGFSQHELTNITENMIKPISDLNEILV